MRHLTVLALVLGHHARHVSHVAKHLHGYAAVLKWQNGIGGELAWTVAVLFVLVVAVMSLFGGRRRGSNAN